MGKKINLRYFLIIITFILLSFVSAYNIYQKSVIIDLKIPFEVDGSIPSGSAECNMSIQYPNGSHLINNGEMTNLNNGEFNYTLNSTQTTILGEYDWVAFCCDGSNCAAGYDTFKITENGKESPSGVVIVLFSILFLGILASLITLILYTLAHFVEKDFDMKDLIFNLSAYFVLWGIYILGKEYVGNYFINTFLEWLIGVGALTNVIIPMIIFIVSITIWKWREELEGKV